LRLKDAFMVICWQLCHGLSIRPFDLMCHCAKVFDENGLVAGSHAL
jgi:hypothetical protein